MPLYEYECDAGHRFEKIQKFSDLPIETCPTCGKPVHKLVSSPAFQFKGTGWYITDYAKKDKDTKDTKDTKEAKEGGESKPSSGKESKDSKDTSTKETPAAKTSDTSSSTTTPSTSSSKDSSKGT